MLKVSGTSMAGAAIWQYENVRSQAIQAKRWWGGFHTPKYNKLEKFPTIPPRSQHVTSETNKQCIVRISTVRTVPRSFGEGHGTVRTVARSELVNNIHGRRGIRDVGTITREQGSGVAGMMSES
ncbi:hypothetical protein J6590_036494 [Homalodisca vitripennis]|nr:hypothetical protein J6590_036494 [Homalodisca vitripennis]